MDTGEVGPDPLIQQPWLWQGESLSAQDREQSVYSLSTASSPVRTGFGSWQMFNQEVWSLHRLKQ